MTPRVSVFSAFFSRAIQALCTRLDRTHEGSDGLEAYLSTATSLHQLEDMQRRWDRNQRGAQSMVAH
ncbi:hypothetical protein [Hydrogenophaga sp.]|uniref:hypothetical protein n=1 Tax=Hydrogenophaga sp. TaxID=1904254 RepID=UPI0027262967|nr:hypothetical protein [Hydrogenophaga sp.]MDO8905056.1 hypothetical protein [Hydrogenophaga sp.]